MLAKMTADKYAVDVSDWCRIHDSIAASLLMDDPLHWIKAYIRILRDRPTYCVHTSGLLTHRI